MKFSEFARDLIKKDPNIKISDLLETIKDANEAEIQEEYFKAFGKKISREEVRRLAENFK